MLWLHAQYLDLREQEYDLKAYVNFYTVCAFGDNHMLIMMRRLLNMMLSLHCLSRLRSRKMWPLASKLLQFI